MKKSIVNKIMNKPFTKNEIKSYKKLKKKISNKNYDLTKNLEQVQKDIKQHLISKIKELVEPEESKKLIKKLNSLESKFKTTIDKDSIKIIKKIKSEKDSNMLESLVNFNAFGFLSNFFIGSIKKSIKEIQEFYSDLEKKIGRKEVIKSQIKLILITLFSTLLLVKVNTYIIKKLDYIFSYEEWISRLLSTVIIGPIVEELYKNIMIKVTKKIYPNNPKNNPLSNLITWTAELYMYYGHVIKEYGFRRIPLKEHLSFILLRLIGLNAHMKYTREHQKGLKENPNKIIGSKVPILLHIMNNFFGYILIYGQQFYEMLKLRSLL